MLINSFDKWMITLTVPGKILELKKKGNIVCLYIENQKIYPLMGTSRSSGLCEIPWVRESQPSAQEIDHIDVVLDVSKAASTSFGQLDFAVDALQHCVGNVRLDKVNDSRPMRSECVGTLLKGWDFCLLNLSTPVVQKGIHRWLVWHRP